MAIKIKIDSDVLSEMIGCCEKCLMLLDTFQRYLDAANDMVISDVSESNSTLYSSYYDDENVKHENYNYISIARTYNTACSNLAGLTNISNFKLGLENYLNCLKNIQLAVNSFNDTIPTLKDALKNLEGANFDNNWMVETVDGTEVAKYKYTDEDGNVSYITVAEMVNCAYTDIGMSMSMAVMQGLNGTLTADEYKNISNYVGGFVSTGINSHAFGVASQEDIEGVAAANNITDINTEYESVLKNITDSSYGDYIGGVMTSGFAVGASLLGAYTLLNNGFKGVEEPTKKTSTDTGTNNAGNNSQPGGTSTNNPDNSISPIDSKDPDNSTSPIDSQDPDDSITPIDSKDPEDTPSNDIKITDPTNESEIPDEIKVDDSTTEKDYDELAREQYETENTIEEIEEYRSDIINDVNTQFDAQNFEPIREKLSEYGYSNDDIELIIKDRQSTINAMLAGDEKQILAESAKNLATKDGVMDFKTDYENTPTYLETVDGTDSTLLLNIGQNEELVSIKNDITNAQTNMTEKMDICNTAINDCKNNLTTVNDLKEKYKTLFGTDDTTKWDEASANSYNDAIKTYNDSVTKAKEAKTDYDTANKAYQDSVSKYETTKNELIEKTRTDNDRCTELGISKETSNEVLDETETLDLPELADNSTTETETEVLSETDTTSDTLNVSNDDLLNLFK